MRDVLAANGAEAILLYGVLTIGCLAALAATWVLVFWRKL